MKFGEHLKQNILHPWKIEYIQYDILKHDLKRKQQNREWDDMDEANFVQLFINERNKVEQFIINFKQQLISRIKYARHLLRSGTVTFQKNQQLQQIVEFLNTLDDSLVEIIFDVHDFSKFIYLNKLGFSKILKKHKKWTQIDHTGKQCFEYQSIDLALGLNWEATFHTQISLLRHQCRHKFSALKTIGIETLVESQKSMPASVSEKTVKKYWILPQHVSEVLAMISMHSFVVPPSTGNLNSSSPDSQEKFDYGMSNVYFDNNTCDDYSNRLANMENTQGVKCKRYGLNSNEHIYFEQEIYNKPYSREISSKKKFKIEYDSLQTFCEGKYEVKCTSEAILTGDMDEKEALKVNLEEEISSGLFAREIQTKIKSSSMAPIIQCNYDRVSFQFHHDENYPSPTTITIDTNISFCALKKNLPKNSVFVSDSDSNYTQEQFQYAVLQIKYPVDIKFNDPSLQWFHSLSQESHLLYEVPQFSKYLQGIYQLFSATKPSLMLPEWNGIYKQGISSLAGSSYGLSRSRSLRPQLNGMPYRSIISYSAAGNINNERSIRKSLQQQQSSIPQKEAAHQPKEDYIISPRHSDTFSSDFTAISINNHFMADEDKLNELHDSKVVLQMNEKIEMNYNQSIKQAKPSTRFFFFGKQNNDDKCILDEDGNPIEYKNQQEKKGKKKAEVIKIEPKAFFANERTFISWLQFCALLLTVALNLLNFGDQVSKICGGIFLFISMMLALYALLRFQYRAWQLRHPNKTARYDDLYGPAVLCILLVAALVINFCLRFRYITNQESQELYPTAS